MEKRLARPHDVNRTAGCGGIHRLVGRGGAKKSTLGMLIPGNPSPLLSNVVGIVGSQSVAKLL